MKKLSSLSVLLGLGLILGCNRATDDTASTSGDTTRTSDTTTRSSDTTPSPTSRDTASSRYADTNAAAAKEADNSGKNVRDRSGDTLTPEDQGGSESDREITRQIRRALTENDQLSTTAKNVKIMTVNGKVTLRGPVTNEQEQQTIAAAVQKVTGVTSVENQLEVKTKTQ